MTDNEVTQDARRHGWDHAVNTGHTYNGYTVYECVETYTPGVFLDTGLPTYVLVKGDEIRGPKDLDEWDAIDDLVKGVTEETEPEAA